MLGYIEEKLATLAWRYRGVGKKNYTSYNTYQFCARMAIIAQFIKGSFFKHNDTFSHTDH